MLINNFYKILTLEQIEDQVNAHIFINKDHDIFKGHFPDNPVMPGVCVLQIIKELTEQITASKLSLVKAHNIKFKAIINPEIHPKLLLQLTIKVDGNLITVKNVTTFEDIIKAAGEVGNSVIHTTIALQLSATYSIQKTI